MTSDKRSALCVLRSAFCIRRFLADDSGQGILFAAATLLVMVGFVAFVFNIGRLLDRRTKVQVAADAAAYSGAMVEANAVSAIAYINSAMSQVYYSSLKYAVDTNEAAVAAELERRMNWPSLTPPQANAQLGFSGVYFTTYQQVYSSSSQGLQQAKQWMLQLSQLENAIAIVTPRLAEEEMFAVAGRAGGERMSVYPSFRMFPASDSDISFGILNLGNGWQITNLNTGAVLTVTLDGGTWDFQWSDNTSSREVKISQSSPTSWQIQFYQPPGSLVQEVSVENDGNLGWVVSGTAPNPNGGPPVPMPPITFTPVDMDNEGFNEGVRVTQGGFSQVMMRGADGNVYVWNGSQYVPMTSNQTTIGGVNVQVNVTNTIHFPGATAQIGQPTTVDVGGAHVVLNNPPTISLGFGPVSIGITGFNPNQFNISVGGFGLMPGLSNGRWAEHYDPGEELWWRNRLTVMGLGANGQPNQWQYDYEHLGALLRYENTGFIANHAFMGSGTGTFDSSTWPAWTTWFNPYPIAGVGAQANVNLAQNPVQNQGRRGRRNNPAMRGAMPYDITTTAPPLPANLQDTSNFGPPDANGIRHYIGAPPPATTYYQTETCAYCNGLGTDWRDGNNTPCSCPVCRGCDYTGTSELSNLRVFIGDLNQNLNPPTVVHLMSQNARNFPDDFYLSAPMFRRTNAQFYPNPAGGGQLGTPSLPLVAIDDFFKWGVNVGVWIHPYNGTVVPSDTPMLFPATREPAWGTAAIASARVGLHAPDAPNVVGLPGGYAWQFGDAGSRANWCSSSPNNLYFADVQATLFSSKNQVGDYDLDTNLLQGNAMFWNSSTNSFQGNLDESGLSYLWSAIISPHSTNGRNDWMDRFNGQADPRVGQWLSNMQDRQGNSFDYGSAGLNEVVQH